MVVAAGFVHVANETLAGILDDAHATYTRRNAGTGIFAQALCRAGSLAFTGLLIDIDTAPEDVDLGVSAARHLDAELGALIKRGQQHVVERAV